jgi:hypothetical protein
MKPSGSHEFYDWIGSRPVAEVNGRRLMSPALYHRVDSSQSIHLADLHGEPPVQRGCSPRGHRLRVGLRGGGPRRGCRTRPRCTAGAVTGEKVAQASTSRSRMRSLTTPASNRRGIETVTWMCESGYVARNPQARIDASKGSSPGRRSRKPTHSERLQAHLSSDQLQNLMTGARLALRGPIRG